MAEARCWITKAVEFDYGHRVPGHDGHCRHLHGHRGKVEMVVEGPIASSGMVVDFGWMKQALMTVAHARFDHCLILDRADPLVGAVQQAGRELLPDEGGFRVTLLDGPPTAENLALDVWTNLGPFLPAGCSLAEVRLWETPSSCAIYRGAT
jgi:6-pyruvoyltetrahydropterin/6-carboxytetrahydropterin synthase